jgi:N-methylhydantoinase A
MARFHAAYEREYTYRLNAPVEIVGLHLVAIVGIDKLGFAPPPVTGATVEAALKSVRDVDFAQEGVHRSDIYDATRLEPGMRFPGPAVIEDPGTTIVVHPGQRVTVDDWGNIHIDL